MTYDKLVYNFCINLLYERSTITRCEGPGGSVGQTMEGTHPEFNSNSCKLYLLLRIQCIKSCVAKDKDMVQNVINYYLTKRR